MCPLYAIVVYVIMAGCIVTNRRKTVSAGPHAHVFRRTDQRQNFVRHTDGRSIPPIPVGRAEPAAVYYYRHVRYSMLHLWR